MTAMKERNEFSPNKEATIIDRILKFQVVIKNYLSENSKLHVAIIDFLEVCYIREALSKESNH